MATVCVKLIVSPEELSNIKKEEEEGMKNGQPPIKVAIKDSNDKYTVKNSRDVDDSEFVENSMYVQMPGPNAGPTLQQQRGNTDEQQRGNTDEQQRGNSGDVTVPGAGEGGKRRKTAKRGGKSSKRGRKSAKRSRKTAKKGRKGKGSRRSKK